MKIHNEFEQGSLTWMMARAGIPTASEFDNLVTPEFKIRTGQMPASYLARKLAEKWLGGPLAGFSVWDVDQGQMLEKEARPFYTLETGEDVQAVGLCTTDDGRIACSPDGLIGDDGGIEIKCPQPEAHVKYLLAGEVPKDYLAQVHGSMLVTGRPWWRFMSYRRHFPPLIVTMERDDEVQEVLRRALADFVERLDAGYQRLCDLNGGPPQRITPEPKPEIISDPCDLIP